MKFLLALLLLTGVFAFAQDAPIMIIEAPERVQTQVRFKPQTVTLTAAQLRAVLGDLLTSVQKNAGVQIQVPPNALVSDITNLVPDAGGVVNARVFYEPAASPK